MCYRSTFFIPQALYTVLRHQILRFVVIVNTNAYGWTQHRAQAAALERSQERAESCEAMTRFYHCYLSTAAVVVTVVRDP